MAVFVPQLAEFQLRADFRRRPIDWRFQRAIDLSRFAPRKRYPRSTDDDLIAKYADLLHRLTANSSMEDMSRIQKRHPDLMDVHLAYATMNKTELALMDGLLLSQSVDSTLITRQSGLTPNQQKLYKRMFLDIDDRRDMTMFVASQLMEPTRLRNTALECADVSSPQSMDFNRRVERGTMSLRSQCVLRVMGFYSSPIVLELLYTGLQMGTIPVGRDSAVRFIVQSFISNLHRYGQLASAELPHSERGLVEVFKLASRLIMEEKEEGQIDILQNIDALFSEMRPRIGVASKILEAEHLPSEAFSGPYEWTEDEMYEASITGRVPGTILELANH